MAASDIAKCATVSEAFEIQTQYAQESFNDLLCEGKKMADMLGELVKESVTMFENVAGDSTAKATKR